MHNCSLSSLTLLEAHCFTLMTHLLSSLRTRPWKPRHSKSRAWITQVSIVTNHWKSGSLSFLSLFLSPLNFYLLDYLLLSDTQMTSFSSDIEWCFCVSGFISHNHTQSPHLPASFFLHISCVVCSSMYWLHLVLLSLSAECILMSLSCWGLYDMKLYLLVSPIISFASFPSSIWLAIFKNVEFFSFYVYNYSETHCLDSKLN